MAAGARAPDAGAARCIAVASGSETPSAEQAYENPKNAFLWMCIAPLEDPHEKGIDVVDEWNTDDVPRLPTSSSWSTSAARAPVKGWWYSEISWDAFSPSTNRHVRFTSPLKIDTIAAKMSRKVSPGGQSARGFRRWRDDGGRRNK